MHLARLELCPERRRLGLLLGEDPVARPDQEAEDNREQRRHHPLYRRDDALGVREMVRRHQPLKEIADDGAGEYQAGGATARRTVGNGTSSSFLLADTLRTIGHIVEICNRRIAEPSANSEATPVSALSAPSGRRHNGDWILTWQLN